MHLLVVAGSDRGLAGGFNATILREARRTIRELTGAGKEVKLLTIGRKTRDSLRRDYPRLIVESLTELGRPRLTFETAQDVAQRLGTRFAAGEFDSAAIVYNRFRSAMTQIVTKQGLIPFAPPEGAAAPAASTAVYEFEPEEEAILPSCCRARSRCSSSPRCSRTRRASRARV